MLWIWHALRPSVRRLIVIILVIIVNCRFRDYQSNTLMNLNIRKSLNKAFLRVKPNRTQIEEFKKNLIQLLDRTNEIESEEFHKNLVSDFLKQTYYDPEYFINTKGRNDLVIHTGKTAKTSVGVIIEAKKPTNKAEMLTIANINSKASF